MSSPIRPRSQDVLTSPVTPTQGSQYPFPSIEPQQKRPLHDRLTLRRESTRNSFQTVGTITEALQGTITESSQNAISTLLQPSMLRTGLQPHNTARDSGYKAPTQRDIPPVALTNIPHVDAKAFHPYLAQVGSLYDAFQRAKSEGEGESSLFHRERRESKADDWENILSKRLQRPGDSRRSSVTSSVGSPLEAPPTPKRRASGQRRHAVTPLSTIPPVYSEEDFHLENPRTFDIVSEKSEILHDPGAPPTGRKSLVNNAILQEKLSWYMDTVEIHLISSISTASKSFFSALGSLRELHTEAADCVGRIETLRQDLAKLDEEMAVGGLKVINLKQRRDNIRKLGQVMMQLEDVVRAFQQCEQQVESGDFDLALSGLESVERLMGGQSLSTEPTDTDIRSSQYKARDLRGIKVLGDTLEDLAQLRSRIGRGFEGLFHNILLGDIRKHIQSVEVNTTLQRWGSAFTRPKAGQRRAPSSFPSYMNVTPDWRNQLEAQMRGLSRAKYTAPAATSFRALVLREMKNVIRKDLPSSTDDDAVSTVSASTVGGKSSTQQERSSILARNLRSLDPDDWYNMLARIYTHLSEGLRRLSVQVKVLLDVTSSLDQPSLNGLKSPPMSPDPTHQGRRPRSMSIQQEVQQALDMSSLLGEAVDSAQTQITKVIKVRYQQNVEMSLTEFLQFFTLNRLFADECEAISGRSGAPLKAVVDSQIKDFVPKFGDGQKHAVVQIMDADKWEAKDFAESDNACLARIVEGSTSNAAAWVQSTMIWEASSNGVTTANGSASKEINGTGKVRSAVLDEQKFILPESAIAMMRSIEQFQHLTTGIPSMSQEIASALLESLRLFNSRASQLILGAGATRSAGLKNITTKHLALSSQALSFIIALIPYVREFFRRQMPAASASQTMAEFDKAKRLLQEHQNSIHEKFVDIMTGRAATHVKTMKAIDWDEAAKNKTSSVSPYMEILTKETTTLQKVLAKHLSEPVVASIMVPVFSSYKEQWSQAYQEVVVHSATAKARLLADVEYFASRISKLDGAGDLGEHMLNVVKSKPIVSDPNKLSLQAKEQIKDDKALPVPPPASPVPEKETAANIEKPAD